MEADFLRSLHQTRQLEAELHDALAAVLKVGLHCCLGQAEGVVIAGSWRPNCMMHWQRF